MKRIFLTIVLFVAVTAAFAQTSVQAPYVGINKRTLAKVLIVPHVPTATVTRYTNGDYAIVNDGVTTFTITYNDETTIWEQKPGHGPKLVRYSEISKKDLLAKN